MSKRMSVASCVPAFVLLSVVTLAPTAVRADNDAIEGPWGTIHADLAGTAATTGIVYNLGEGQLEEKWRLDIIAEGHDRPAGRSSIVFDRDGNLYWITNTVGGTGGVVRLVSAAPNGTIRWFGNDGAGNVHALGSAFGGASPVVGQARVYGTGDAAGAFKTLLVAAYDRATGRNLWSTELLPSDAQTGGRQLTPVLYQGKLYVVGVSDTKSQDVHCVDAETGDVEWSSTIPEVAISASIVGQMAFVPDAFAAGVHGIYFNGDSNGGADGISEVYGIQIHQDEAMFGWMSEGGKVGRSHVIYSAADGLLYTLTWSDYGRQFYVFDPASGFVADHANSKQTGHGFYDVGALEFDGKSVIAGGFDGYILRYAMAGDGTISDEVLYQGGSAIDTRWWGETRINGQLLRDAANHSILIAATNSLECCPTHVVAIDVTEKKLLWEYDTRIVNPHGFNYAGGPIMGPDGKIYYFDRPRDIAPGSPPTTLVAIGLAAEPPKPTAGLIMVGHQGREFPTRTADPCLWTGETLRLDGGCSTGRGLTYQYSVDPPDNATIVQSSTADPNATLRIDVAGDYVLHLLVTNAAGTAEYVRPICVADVPPVCALAVTELDGDPLDDAEDDDGIPCLAVGGTALADAGGSFGGGNLEFLFTVDPADGVDIDHPDSTSPRAQITFANPGIYTVAVALTNDLGASDCAAERRTICVATTPLACALAVTNLGGGPIDDVDDDDEVPCLAAGGTALADASASTGALEYAFAVAPPAGVTVIQAGGPTDPVGRITFANAGTYSIQVTARNGEAVSNCAPATICVTQAGGSQKPMDMNQDNRRDISDAIAYLNYLFSGGTAPPCGDNRKEHPANIELLDCNGDGRLDISDAVCFLAFLFTGGPPPVLCIDPSCQDCVRIADCPDVCTPPEG